MNRSICDPSAFRAASYVVGDASWVRGGGTLASSDVFATGDVPL